MLAGVLLPPLPLALPGHLSGSLDEFLKGCPSLDLPTESLRELGLLRAPVVGEPRFRCWRFLCHGPVSVTAHLASPWNVLGGGSI